MNIKPLNTDFASDDMSTWIYHMIHDRMYLPDTMRDYNVLIDTIRSACPKCKKPMGIYKDGKLAGVYTITDVVPTHQARLLLWAWGSWFAGDTVTEIKKYIEEASQEYGLKRVYAQTPDRKQIRLLGIVGFSEEGRFKRAYQVGGKLYKLYQTRMLIGG